MKSRLNWNNKIIEIQIIISIVRVIEHFSNMLVLSGVFNTRILDATNYVVNQDYMRVNYTLIVVYTMLLVTGIRSNNVSCFCLDLAQWRLLIGQSLCNAIYWSNMDFSVYWCSRWNGHIESTLKWLLMASNPLSTGKLISKSGFFPVCSCQVKCIHQWPHLSWNKFIPQTWYVYAYPKSTMIHWFPGPATLPTKINSISSLYGNKCSVTTPLDAIIEMANFFKPFTPFSTNFRSSQPPV
jgi:hypothetical protein